MQDSTTTVLHCFSKLVIQDGYMMFFIMYITTYDIYISVIKITHLGMILWPKKYTIQTLICPIKRGLVKLSMFLIIHISNDGYRQSAAR